jgi:hypothetical protein
MEKESDKQLKEGSHSPWLPLGQQSDENQF